MKIYRLIIASLLLMANVAWSQVNINTATVEELTALPGIGEKKAQAIVKYRKKHGRFSSASDLTNVKGIGDQTIVNLGSNIKTSGKTNVDKVKKTTSTKKKVNSKSKKTNKKASTQKKKATKKKNTQKQTKNNSKKTKKTTTN